MRAWVPRWAVGRGPFGLGVPTETLTGAAAATDGRHLLEAAGVDTDAVERRVGRPRLGAPAPRGTRSPRLHVAVSAEQSRRLEELTVRLGRSRSELMREALDRYLDETD